MFKSKKTSWLTLIIIILGIIIIAALEFFISKAYQTFFSPKIDKVEPAVVIPETATSSFKIYFNNTNLNPNTLDCNLVYPLERSVPKTSALARAALQELFKGPSAAEKLAGYSSWFSLETENILEDLKIENKVAYLNLKDIRQIIPNASTSCGSAELLAEISTTLKQFPSVERVVISIDGQPETFYEWLQLSFQPGD